MLEKQEWSAVLIMAGVVLICCVASLLLVPLGKEPFSKPFQNDYPDGTLVRFSGVVEKITVTKGGDHLIGNVSGVQVFVPISDGRYPLMKGDTVMVIGILQTYQGKKEIVVESGSDIRSLVIHQG